MINMLGTRVPGHLVPRTPYNPFYEAWDLGPGNPGIRAPLLGACNSGQGLDTPGLRRKGYAMPILETWKGGLSSARFTDRTCLPHLSSYLILGHNPRGGMNRFNGIMHWAVRPPAHRLFGLIHADALPYFQ